MHQKGACIVTLAFVFFLGFLLYKNTNPSTRTAKQPSTRACTRETLQDVLVELSQQPELTDEQKEILADECGWKAVGDPESSCEWSYHFAPTDSRSDHSWTIHFDPEKKKWLLTDPYYGRHGYGGYGYSGYGYPYSYGYPGYSGYGYTGYGYPYSYPYTYASPYAAAQYATAEALSAQARAASIASAAAAAAYPYYYNPYYSAYSYPYIW